MRSYQESADPSKQEFGDNDTTTFMGKVVPSMYRTWVAIATLIFTLICIIVIAAGSGKGKPEGGKTPRVAVIVAQGLDADALRAAMASNKAPNLQSLTSMGGFAVCGDDAPCATSPGAANGLNALLTGYWSKNTNASAPARPSFLQKAKSQEYRPSIIASTDMFSGSEIDTETGLCQKVGVLDTECFQDACPEADKPETCNRESKYAYVADGTKGGIFDAFVDSVKSYSDLIYVHLKQNQVAGDASSFTDSSLQYLSSIYMVDALVGNVLTVIRDRAAEDFENWLIVVTAPNGGKTAEQVPLFISGFNDGKPIDQAPLSSPVRVTDVYPTVMRWLGVKSNVLETGNVDGKVQGICSTGVLPPKSCAATSEAVKEE